MAGKPSEYTTRYGCYVRSTAHPVKCSFTHVVTGEKSPNTDINNTGGHVSGHGTRLLTLDDNPLRFDGEDSDNSKFGVAGFTKQGDRDVAAVIHEMPEASGTLAGNSSLTILENYWCWYECYTNKSWRWKDSYELKYKGLTENPLPNSGQYHIVVRGDGIPGGGQHPSGTHGMPDSINTLLRIAEEYYKLTGYRLSINDVSLPFGGLFDMNFQFNSSLGHSTHRTGRDADINQADERGIKIPCAADELFKKSVREVASGGSRPKYECENTSGENDPNGPRKHLDL
ncbi:MAG: hypothetical protein BMS9Abin36_0751 [Gammaproteobacteria bacterium]|nr:MAG: hypothetical protein BMS9Abin36_0751 [Gammaproteobacteria bacterium]